MLGWEVFIYRLKPGQAPESASAHRNTRLASWRESLGGLGWIEQLVEAGRAEFRGGNGYPFCYTARAEVLLAWLADGPMRPDGAPVIGDGYALPGDHIWRLEADSAEIGRCPPEEELSVLVWDLS